jgi:glycosyltransferase involved in cell wall biosynthesis
VKLIIQIPCYNEEKTLPLTFHDLPKSIEGIDTIEVQVIDDGSEDRTKEVARNLGIKHIISFKKNSGLAAAFMAGVNNALANGADILVNTDADNQYAGQDIIKLIEPILDGSADLVIGNRPINNHPEFSFIKKKLQKIGSWVLRKISGTNIEDAASGFRAYNKDAMLHTNVFSDFSYCMETLIQAGYNNIKISSTDINVNPRTRESRLYKNIFQYIWKSGKTIISVFLLYRSYYLFTLLSVLMLFTGCVLVFRYIYLIIMYRSLATSFFPTIILAGILLAISFQMYLTGILSSLISSNRKLSEEILFRLKKNESENSEKQ